MNERRALTVDLIQAAIDEQGISIRKAAKQIGTSHSTLSRILKGKPYDWDTAEKIATWLGISVRELLDPGEESEVALLFDWLFRHEPMLEEVMIEGVKKLLRGEISFEAFKSVGWYIAYRINKPYEAMAENSEIAM
jgi:transcriptional regulator with XRE-family HTH domain